jgi:nucleoside-diphosphate-sugar epimerase
MSGMSATPPVDVEALDELLSRPTEAAVAALARGDGDLLLLGAGGKMGPSLARMAVRGLRQAGRAARVFAASRYSQDGVRERLEAVGVEPIVCDLLAEDQLRDLPDAATVIQMTGYKFGAAQDPGMAWAMNCHLPSLIAQRFARSRIVAFSTGNVYPLVEPATGGCTEEHPCGPIGEYAMTALGRERLLQYFSRRQRTPLALLRLNYAVELRYGVLVDLARQVLMREPIDLTMSHVNVIWQADANAAALAAIEETEIGGRVLNIAGPEMLSVREVAEQFGALLERTPTFAGQPGATSLLNNGSAARRLWGPPRIDASTLIEWTASWLTRGLPTFNKPTHFQVTNGGF